MQNKCSFSYCLQQNSSNHPNQKQVFCQQCGKNYCSDLCMKEDWQSNHRITCMNNVSFDQQSTLENSISSTSTSKKSLDDYDIIQLKNKKNELGRGAYGSVKLVREKTTGTRYAMKIMAKKHIFQYCTVDNLKREIKIQKKLSHPHTIKLYHFFEDKENVYLILEYAENGSLFSFLRKKCKFNEGEAFIYFFQTLLGIDYLHKKNIIHRDLKPENLLIDGQGNIKLCDFGWSAEVSLLEKRKTFCGTIDYMAPEMIKNQPHDHSLDIWCLGILLFELLHGFAPFQGQNDQEKCKNIANNAPIIFSPGISYDCQDLIQNILRQKPMDRLKMNQILLHPWMKKQEKSYGIDMSQYVYKPQQKKQEQENNYKQQSQNHVSPASKGNKQIDLTMSRVEQPEPYQSKYVQSKLQDNYKSQQNFKLNHDYNQSKPQYDNYGQSQQNFNQKPPQYQEKNQQQNQYKQKQIAEIGQTQGNQNDEFSMARVSRVSQRNQFAQNKQKKQDEVQDKDDGFFTKMFTKLGCINRDNNKQENNMEKKQQQ